MLTHERLLQYVSYDQKTGIFIRVATGRRIGTGKSDYGVIGIDGKTYKSHRLAWFYVKGEWPAGDIDHKDLDRTNNCISNLRDASRSLNKRNSPTYSNNKAGFKGVSLSDGGGSFRAQISINGRSRRIGTFETAEAAHAAYVAESSRLFGEFARAS